ncbi:MAG: S1 family peptidase [Fusobacteriaceae bacterium]
MFTNLVCTIGKLSKDTLNVDMLGTGFLIDSSNGLIAVPRHIIGDSNDGLCVLPSGLNSINEYQDTSDNRVTSGRVTIHAIDNVRDIALLKINDINIIKLPLVSSTILGSFDEINVGETLHILGYPHCVEGRRVLTYQEAILGAKVLLDCNSIKSKHAVINTQTRPGQSGSLIYSKRLNKIIGMLIGAFAPNSGISLGGINPRELHQTTHCISAEYIADMI